MALLDIWTRSPEQLADKHVQQVIAFAGEGKLRDGNDCSAEFRLFLAQVPSELLRRYADECLTSKFEDGGSALQDVLNEVGRRLGFAVTNGRYRGVAQKIGNDGLWVSQGGHAIVLESKTTDAYRIPLDVLAGYRRSLVLNGEISEQKSSVLIVVGRQDTGDLEAQIRGSRHAWEIRLVSVEALLRLMVLKEEVEDPGILAKVQDVLVPREFTKLDGIIDLVFSTAEDLRLEGALPEADAASDEIVPKFVPVNFNEACVQRIQETLACALTKRSRATFASSDGSLVVVCTVSREHKQSGNPVYWFAIHPHQIDALKAAPKSFLAFGCGSADNTLLIPLADFSPWLDSLWVTRREDRFYWHVKLVEDNDRLILQTAAGRDRVDVTGFLLPVGAQPPAP